MHIFKGAFPAFNQKFIISTKFPAFNGELDLMNSRDPYLFKLFHTALIP